MIEPMKKILLTLSLLCGLMATVSAQGLYQLYGSFDNEQHLDKTADYLTLPQGMNIAVLYTNTPLINRPQNAELLTQTGLLPETMVGTLTQSHGYSITSDYIQPIWGPFGITFNWMDMTMTFGKWDTNKLKTGVPSEATGDAMMFSWGIGIMPTFGVNFGNSDKAAWIRLIQSVTGRSRDNIKDRLYFKFEELQTQKDLRIVSGCMRELFPSISAKIERDSR